MIGEGKKRVLYEAFLEGNSIWKSSRIVGVHHRTARRYLRELHDRLVREQFPACFDRAAVVQYMLGPVRNPILPYSVRLDRELRRIARLSEPNRTILATELWEVFHDARSVADALKKYHTRTNWHEIERMDGRVRRLLSDLTDPDVRAARIRRRASGPTLPS